MKLDIRPTIVGNSALDGGGFIYRREGESMSLPRWEPQTKLGLYKTEKEKESECWVTNKGVWSWI